MPHPYPRPPAGDKAASLAPLALARLIEQGLRATLVDLRTAEERRIAAIPGDRWIPMAQLPARAKELPPRSMVVFYDHRGEKAPRAAEWLGRTLGRPSLFLDGGIDAFAAQAAPDIGRYAGPPSTTLLVQLPRPDTGCLTYFFGDPDSREAILVDPGAEVGPYFARLKSGGWTLKAIVETHTHADHISGHALLHQRTGAPVFLSPRSKAAYHHRTLADGEALEFGSLRVVGIESPGHTPDHLTLHMGTQIFTGDALLIGSCGRTDLGVGDPRKLFETLHSKYGPLSDATEVYPAHYGAKHALVAKFVSTLGWERATNEALLIPDEEGFVKYMTEGWPPKPADFEAIVAANLADT